MDGMHDNWSLGLVAEEHTARIAPLAARLATGLGLAGLYGLALGARDGGVGLLAHMLFVPAGIAVVATVGVPALYIVLALADAPLDVAKLARSSVRAIGTMGLVLAGFAPLVALFVVTSESRELAVIVGVIGLAVGGLSALKALATSLREPLAESKLGTRLGSWSLVTAFCLFATVMAARVWMSALPLFAHAGAH